ncbi:MAG: 6-phosphogluconolactonase, partial [Candidatus Paceibacterota bacterium]
SNKKVLWLLSGGSNIPISVEIMNMIHKEVSVHNIKNLTVTLTDERFGDIDHADSNWKQLKDAGFDFSNINSMTVLQGLSFEETISDYSKNVMQAMDIADLIIAQLGIGNDGHIAGILSDSPAISTSLTEFACGYDTAFFKRITLTFNALKKCDSLYAFAFGKPKKGIIDIIRNNRLIKLPVLIIGEMKNFIVYTDQ